VDLISHLARRGLLDESSARTRLGAAAPSARTLAQSGIIRSQESDTLVEEYHRFLAREAGKGALDAARCGRCAGLLTASPDGLDCTNCGTRIRRESGAPDTSAELQAATRDPARRLGKYVLLGQIGRGAFATVHRAWDQSLSRVVAVKILKTDDPEARARFEREARVAARLSHPNIIPIHEVGSHDGRTYIVMQLVRGEPLSQMRLPARRVLELLRDAALAVAEAHRHGVIHRDIKPENLMIEQSGRIFVTDFGLAREVQVPSTASMDGDIIGTPAFMSPEQARGRTQEIDTLTDVYCLGATLYAALAGRPPFEGASPWEVVNKVLESEPPPLKPLDPDTPSEAEAIIRRAMRKDKTQRYPDAAALAADLQRLLDRQPLGDVPARPTRRRLWAAIAGIGLMGAAVLVAVRLQRPTPAPVEPNPPAVLQRPAVSAPPRPGRLEARVRLDRVTDADGLDVTILEVADPSKQEELRCRACAERHREERRLEGETAVRLGGGIDAPELGTPGGDWATQFVTDQLAGADEIWIDLDDAGGPCQRHGHKMRDRFCRLLAQVWIRKGDRWFELSRVLLEEGMKQFPQHNWLRYRNFASEFDLERPSAGDPTKP
jgi:hypothetical protein